MEPIDTYYPCGAHVSEGDLAKYHFGADTALVEVIETRSTAALVRGRFGKRLKGMDRKLQTAIVSAEHLELVRRTQ